MAYDDSALPRGEISLECDSLLCSFRWFTRQSTLAALYENGDWEALAEQVSSLQYGQDLAYFYLGRAAEERQAYDAAQLYFTRAQSTSLRCSTSLFNRCQGIEVETSSRERANQIAMMLAAKEMDLADAQQILSDMGLYTAKVDGIYGPRTRAALHQFQESRRLSKSGKLDQATIRALVAAEASGNTQVAASTRSKSVAAPAPEPARPTRVAVARAEPKSTVPASSVAKNTAPKTIEPADPVVHAVPREAAEPTRDVARATASEETEPAPFMASGAAHEAMTSAPVIATSPAVETAGPFPVVAISTIPQTTQLTPAPALGNTVDATELKFVPTQRRIEQSTELAPVPARSTAAPVADVTTPAVRADGLKNAEVAPVAPAPEPENTTPIASEPLVVAEAVDTRSFAPDREAERTRLKLEVDLLSQADPFAEVLGVVEQGAWVDVIDWGSEWSKVSHGDTTGYVYTEVLQ